MIKAMNAYTLDGRKVQVLLTPYLKSEEVEPSQDQFQKTVNKAQENTVGVGFMAGGKVFFNDDGKYIAYYYGSRSRVFGQWEDYTPI